MDVRDYALQEDTGFTHGRDMIEVCGPRSHRKPIEVRHYYAGYRANDAPVRTENRNIEPRRRQLSTSDLVSEFVCMLAIHELTLVYIDEFQATRPDETFSSWWEKQPADVWVNRAFIWPGKYLEAFMTFNKAWISFLERGKHGEL